MSSRPSSARLRATSVKTLVTDMAVAINSPTGDSVRSGITGFQDDCATGIPASTSVRDLVVSTGETGWLGGRMRIGRDFIERETTRASESGLLGPGCRLGTGFEW